MVLYLAVGTLLAAMFGFRRMLGSDYGLILKAINDNDRSVTNAGLNIYWFKTQALFMASAVGAFAGAFMTHVYMFVGMPVFALDYSILPIAAAVVGGPGTLAGATFGACILVPLSEILRGIGDIERIIARIALRSARPRDLSVLREALGLIANGGTITFDPALAGGLTPLLHGFAILAAMLATGYMGIKRAGERLHELAPNLEIDIVASNELRDLRRREADIAIRHVRPHEPDLVGRLVNESEGSLYASERYLSKYGRPRSPADLEGHYFIGSNNPHTA